MTDCERHVQHRCHGHLRRLFREIEANPIVKGRLPARMHLKDLAPMELLTIFQAYRAGRG